MIQSLRGRAAFQRLRLEGRRASSGPLWCQFRLDDHAESSRIAFAIGRKVGTAVVRNRLRRRTREILRASSLPPGDFLWGVNPAGAALSADEFRGHVMKLVAACRRGGNR